MTSASRLVYGAMVSLMTLADALRDERHAVEFIAWKGRQFGEEARRRGFSATEFRVRTKIDPLAIAAMVRHFRARRFDVVHTHLSTSSVNGCLAARIARVPCVATVHGMSGKLSFLAADRLIAVSNGVRDHLAAQGLDGRKIDVVYNGLLVPETLPSRAMSRAEFGFGDEETVVGTVARAVSVKGYDDLLRAFATVAAEVPLARFLCVGDGDEASVFHRRAHSLGLGERITWTGYRSDVWPALAAMDVFAFASHKEAMGIAVLEAMAAGLPVVSTDVGGLPEVLGGTGQLVPPHRPDRLAGAILATIVDRREAEKSAIVGRERASTIFSVPTMRDATVAVYSRLIASQSTTGRYS